MTFQTPTSMASRAGLVGPGTPGMMMTPEFPVSPLSLTVQEHGRLADWAQMQGFNNFDFQPFPEQFLGDFFNLNVPESWPFNGV